MRLLRPRSGWGRVALWSGGLTIFFVGLHMVRGFALNRLLSGWAMFFFLIFAFCILWLGSRWVWRVLMWRLRHRLLVTYIFMGVIPIALLLLLAGVSAYMLAGQFATYVAISNLHSESLHLETANDSLAGQLSTLDRSGKLDKHVAGELAAASGEGFPQRTVSVWEGKDAFVFSADGALIGDQPVKVPESIKGDFSDFVADGDSLYLRAVKTYGQNSKRLTVISSVPITPELIQSATSRLGLVKLIPLGSSGNLDVTAGPSGATFNGKVQKRVEAGQTPPPSNRFDPVIRFYSLFNLVKWENGKSTEGAIGVDTRPSILYNILFASLGDNAQIMEYGLLVIVGLLGLVELVALFIGIRLSRRVTGAVGELYKATQHVNRGDLQHRIQIRGSDQMAALEQSFNSMTESLVKLLAEQKQKQRMESELAFAYEVQDLLFPHKFLEHAALDVFGVCRPARSVSGDYYDFIPLGSDRLVLAVGDISGKGISAALLMATVHAFVRAYSLAPDMLLSPALGAGTLSNVDLRLTHPGDGAIQLRLSPGMLMATLNHQLVRCTPPEKYATMFLGCYDPAMRELTYCNAGHLPPILLSTDGKISRLEPSSTVAGLFDSATYGDATIAMESGDLLVAFSDGVTEPENNSVEFGEERLIELIQEHRHQPLSFIGDAITNAVVRWIGNAEQPDDVTVVLARAR